MAFCPANLPPVFAESRRPLFLGIVGCALIQGVLAVIIALQTRVIFSAFGDQTAVPLQPLVILGTAAVLIAVLRVAEKVLGDMLGYDYVRVLRIKLFNHISRLPVENLSSHKQGSLNIRFVGDLSAIQAWVSRAIPGLISAAVLLPGLVLFLYWLHPAMAVAGLLCVTVCVAMMHWLSSRLAVVQKAVRSKRGGIASYVTSRLGQAAILRVMGLRSKFSEQIEARSTVLQDAAVNKSFVVNSFKSVPDIFLLSLYLVCIVLAFKMGMSAPEAAVILAIIGIFGRPFSDLADFWEKRSAFLVSQQKCSQLLSATTVSSGKKSIISTRQVDQVVIKVSRQGTELQDYVDSVIPSDVHTLVVGESGSGKSSFLRVLMGISQPTAGNIFINDTPAALISEKSRQRLFTYIDDVPPIYASTLRGTIKLGVSRKVTDEELEAVLDSFELRRLADRLGGMSGRVYEHGKNLSKGEIARIACCRAFLSSAKFILIDDLDALGALAGRKAIELLLAKKQSRIIACSKGDELWEASFQNHYEMPSLDSWRSAA